LLSVVGLKPKFARFFLLFCLHSKSPVTFDADFEDDDDMSSSTQINNTTKPEKVRCTDYVKAREKLKMFARAFYFIASKSIIINRIQSKFITFWFVSMTAKKTKKKAV
jgi:hypothetical protein